MRGGRAPSPAPGPLAQPGGDQGVAARTWGSAPHLSRNFGHRTLRTACLLVLAFGLCAQETKQLSVRVESGKPYRIRITGSGGVNVAQSGSSSVLSYPEREVRPIQNLQVIWADLLAHSDADTVRRLTRDPAYRPDPRRLTVELNPEGTEGFTLTVDQMLAERAFWIPSLDVFVTTGDAPVSLAEHKRGIAAENGKRILDQVHNGSEAGYEQFKALWEDMGSPSYHHPAQQGPGHIVCLTWDSAIPKFGIDRGAGVWNDYGNPDRFRFWFTFSELAAGIEPYWKSQRLADGLPVITTVLERDGVRYEVEQFAFPLDGVPARRTGDIAMVLLAKVRLTNLEARARTVPVSMAHLRKFGPAADAEIVVERHDGMTAFEDRGQRSTILALEPGGAAVSWNGVEDSGGMKRVDATVLMDLPAGGSGEFVVKLPSPAVSYEERGALAQLDYVSARERTLAFWSAYVKQGAQFEVPEKAVNDLFRATLWHALRLPRRHAETGGPATIDLPYSNFAYDQFGTPWPVNQAVYVDYMLYDLRGYPRISAEEIDAIYRNSQESSGRVTGWAHWVVYTPGMLYAVAQNYLLSGDRSTFERLLPRSLRAMDWCLEQVRKAPAGPGPEQGLVFGALNDLTGGGYWAFNQAYIYAGLDLFGNALERFGHPRARECLDAAHKFRAAIERAFQMAAVRSPLVELRDRTWMPYVPCDATQPGRLLSQWYPTDVDTGAVHLLRLKALPANGELADSLLNDHEDNLYLNGWGIANEPVYNQQATAYLLRDDVKAAVRAFYSYMASAFSHSVFEPVEHRWRWGQFFGPPSTDGAWFELYRNMLLRETGDGSLLLAQATPRKWLEDGRQINVQAAPTYFGKVSYRMESHAAKGAITVSVDLEKRTTPNAVLIRVRHPDAKPMRAVTVNGAAWKDFSIEREWVRISKPAEASYSVVVSY